jgi:hypothetical protein
MTAFRFRLPVGLMATRLPMPEIVKSTVVEGYGAGHRQ